MERVKHRNHPNIKTSEFSSVGFQLFSFNQYECETLHARLIQIQAIQLLVMIRVPWMATEYYTIFYCTESINL